MNKERAVLYGKAIQEARHKRGWSSSYLAKKAGVSRATVSAWENGHIKMGSQPTLEKIARALALEIRDLETLEGAEARAWDELCRAVEVSRKEVNSGRMSKGLALHTAAMSLALSGAYEIRGSENYGFGIRPVDQSPGPQESSLEPQEHGC